MPELNRVCQIDKPGRRIKPGLMFLIMVRGRDKKSG